MIEEDICRRVLDNYLNGETISVQAEVLNIPYSTLYKELRNNYDFDNIKKQKQILDFNKDIQFIKDLGSDIKLNIDDNHTLQYTDWKGVKGRYYFLCSICKKDWKYITFDQVKANRSSVCKKCSVELAKQKQRIDYDYILEEVKKCNSEIRKYKDLEMSKSDWGRIVDKYWIKCNICNKWLFVEYRNFIKKYSGTCNACRGSSVRWTTELVNEYCKNVNSEFRSDIWVMSDTKYTFACVNCGEDIIKSFTKFKEGQNTCEKCYRERIKLKMSKSNEEYLEELRFNNIDIVPLEEYQGGDTPIKHRCPKCLSEDWTPTPTNIISGHSNSCMGCRSSRGEDVISNYLNLRNIRYVKEYKFKDLKSSKNYYLRFDFAVFDGLSEVIVIIIEYDGLHHYEPIHYSRDISKNISSFERTKYNDAVKNQYCKDNNIPLLRIPYWEFENIEDLLNSNEIIKNIK